MNEQVIYENKPYKVCVEYRTNGMSTIRIYYRNSGRYDYEKYWNFCRLPEDCHWWNPATWGKNFEKNIRKAISECDKLTRQRNGHDLAIEQMKRFTETHSETNGIVAELTNELSKGKQND